MQSCQPCAQAVHDRKQCAFAHRLGATYDDKLLRLQTSAAPAQHNARILLCSVRTARHGISLCIILSIGTVRKAHEQNNFIKGSGRWSVRPRQWRHKSRLSSP